MLKTVTVNQWHLWFQSPWQLIWLNHFWNLTSDTEVRWSELSVGSATYIFYLNRCCSWVHETLTLNLLKNHFVKGCYNMCDWNINSSTHRSQNGQNLFLLWEHTENQTSRLWGKKEWSKVVKGLAKQIFLSSTMGNVGRTVLRICIPG